MCIRDRRSIGILDYSTLGKIEVEGRDAARFLNLVYTNDRSRLGIGRCSYGSVSYTHLDVYKRQGKAMMAFFTDERTKEFASATGLPSVTNRTITTYRALLKELEQVRVQGYAIDVEESGHLLWGVAAPIFDHNGDVVAAVGVSGTVISLKQNADFLIQEVCKSCLLYTSRCV